VGVRTCQPDPGAVTIALAKQAPIVAAGEPRFFSRQI
jgi:hypothetical protein